MDDDARQNVRRAEHPVAVHERGREALHTRAGGLVARRAERGVHGASGLEELLLIGSERDDDGRRRHAGLARPRDARVHGGDERLGGGVRDFCERGDLGGFGIEVEQLDLRRTLGRIFSGSTREHRELHGAVRGLRCDEREEFFHMRGTAFVHHRLRKCAEDFGGRGLVGMGDHAFEHVEFATAQAGDEGFAHERICAGAAGERDGRILRLGIRADGERERNLHVHGRVVHELREFRRERAISDAHGGGADLRIFVREARGEHFG